MTLIQLFTSIANAIRGKDGTSATINATDFPTRISAIQTGKLTNAEYSDAIDDVDDILENAQLPSGTINITENGQHDVTNYTEANVNVQSSTFVLPNTIKFAKTNVFPSGFITTNITAMSYFLESANIRELPLIDTSNAENMEGAFYYCQYMTTVPVLNASKNENFRNTFKNCTSLSNESLNNILETIANATWYNSHDRVRTLNWLGLSSAQAATCTTLSNWAAAEAAGWSTGY